MVRKLLMAVFIKKGVPLIPNELEFVNALGFDCDQEVGEPLSTDDKLKIKFTI